MIGERLLRVAHHAFIILVVLASTIVLSAQTVVDPQYVEFTASADHDAVASDGTPLVQRYSLSIFAVGSSVAFDTVDLGKPAPSAGVIRVNFIPLLHTQPTPNVVFEARVTAVGPGGSTASSTSNGFSFQATPPPCAPTINSTGQSVGSGATTGSVGVTAGTGCAWTAASNAGWVTLTGATSGTGNGSVPYSIAANTATSARTATLTVAGKPYTITQAALSCTYAIAPTSGSVPAGGGTGSTGVTSPAGCAWTGVSNSTSWLTVTGGASGSGNGTVAFSAAANSSTSSRTGTLTIAGQSFSVTQPGIACTYAIAPTSGSVAGGRRHGFDGRHVAGRVCVDRREQQHVVADGHGWRERQWQRHGGVQRGGQQQHQSAHGHADDCWTELQRDAAGPHVHVFDRAHERLGAGGWRHGFDGRDVAGRVCVDRREQQHVLADGHGWRERQRQRHGGVQRRRQQQHQFAHGHADDCWTELQRDAAGHHLHVFDLCRRAARCRQAAARVRRA